MDGWESVGNTFREQRLGQVTIETQDISDFYIVKMGKFLK